MKIFIDIGHPAHVHYFKNLIKKLSANSHSFVVTARDKDIAHYLLKYEGIDFTSRGKGADGVLGKALYLVKADSKLLRIAWKERPDLFLSFGSPYCAHVSSLMGKDHIVIDDTENASLGQLLYKPFTNCFLTPDCFKKDFGSKQIRFPSYMELSYLHPNNYTPDSSVLDDLGSGKDEQYVILRFVGWGAAHDMGHSGISLENKIRAVHDFSEHARVFISSEKELPADLKDYQIDIPPEKMHDALAFATMFYGESATMASESAVLGTPAIYLDNEGRGYTTEQEHKYGLVYNFSESEEDQLQSIEQGIEILKQYDKEKWQNRRKKMLGDKIDLTSFLVWFINNYPASVGKWRAKQQSIIKNFI